MLTEERIEEYTKRGYSPRKLVESHKNIAKNWQVKTAMSLIDPKDYDHDLMSLPLAVWRVAEQLRDSEQVEVHINQARAGVELLKVRDECYRLKGWLVACGIVWYHTVFIISVIYFLGS
jgi:hypothetical protein